MTEENRQDWFKKFWHAWRIDSTFICFDNDTQVSCLYYQGTNLQTEEKDKKKGCPDD